MRPMVCEAPRVAPDPCAGQLNGTGHGSRHCILGRRFSEPLRRPARPCLSDQGGGAAFDPCFSPVHFGAGTSRPCRHCQIGPSFPGRSRRPARPRCPQPAVGSRFLRSPLTPGYIGFRVVVYPKWRRPARPRVVASKCQRGAVAFAFESLLLTVRKWSIVRTVD